MKPNSNMITPMRMRSRKRLRLSPVKINNGSATESEDMDTTPSSQTTLEIHHHHHHHNSRAPITSSFPAVNLVSTAIDDIPMETRDLILSFIERMRSIEPMECCFNPYSSGDAIRDAIRCENLRLYLFTMARLKPDTVIVGEAPGYRGCRWTGVPFSSERIIMDATHPLYGASLGYRPTSTIVASGKDAEDEDDDDDDNNNDGGGDGDVVEVEEEGDGVAELKNNNNNNNRKKESSFNDNNNNNNSSCSNSNNNNKRLIAESSATILWNIIKSCPKTLAVPPLMWNAFPLHPYKAGMPMSNRAPTQAEIATLSWSLHMLLREIFPQISIVVALGRKAEKLLMATSSASASSSSRSNSNSNSSSSSNNNRRGPIIEPTIHNKHVQYVRHPSQGGKNECEAALKKIFAMCVE